MSEPDDPGPSRSPAVAPAPVALAMLDARGIVVWINAAFVVLTGRPTVAAIGQHVDSLFGGTGATPWLPAPGAPERRELHRADGTAWLADVQCESINADLCLVTLADRSRDALLETENRRLAGLLEFVQTQAGIGMWDRDVNTLEGHWDAHMFRFFGLDPARGLPTMSQISQASMPRDGLFRALSESLRVPGRYAHRYRLLTPEGDLRRIRSHWQVFAGADGQAENVVGLVMDDTETFALASATTDGPAPLQLAAELAEVSMWRHDLRARRLYFNQHAFQVLGLEPRSDGLSIDEITARIHADDLREAAATFQRALRSNRPEDLLARYRHEDGAWRHLFTRRVTQRDGFGQPIAFVGVTIDVTAREQALAALREATERSALAARAAGIGIWEFDARSGIAHWDEQMFALRGVTRGAGEPSAEERRGWVHPDDLALVDDQIRRAALEDRPATYEFRVVLPDGAVRWLASRSLPLRDEHGRARTRLGVNWDITEAHAAAAARQERALAQRENEAKSELLARMSHELRTPMNAVLGFTRLLLADDDQESRVGARPDAASDAAARTRIATRHDRLEHIRIAGEHLMTLINDVLELSRLDQPAGEIQREPVALGPLVAELLPGLERLAQEHGVRIVAPVSNLQARADAGRLRQVLVNLVSNAIKYNRPGGSVRLEMARADRTEGPDRGRVRLSVVDDGIGMTTAQQELAFEPFNRAGAERDGIDGTGIGLTVVRALVERMGGRVGVRSTPGIGSVFEVWLDAVQEHDEPAPQHELEAPSQDGAPADESATRPERTETPPDPAGEEPPRRLLYVEDNAVNVLIVSELVRRRGGIDFESAPDGLSGVTRAAAWRPALTLIDMQLPDIDGLEVLRRLRADPATTGLRLVALSANAIPADIQRALDAGFDDYWTKPLDFAVFDAAIDRVFGPRAAVSRVGILPGGGSR